MIKRTACDYLKSHSKAVQKAPNITSTSSSDTVVFCSLRRFQYKCAIEFLRGRRSSKWTFISPPSDPVPPPTLRRPPSQREAEHRNRAPGAPSSKPPKQMSQKWPQPPPAGRRLLTPGLTLFDRGHQRSSNARMDFQGWAFSEKSLHIIVDNCAGRVYLGQLMHL